MRRCAHGFFAGVLLCWSTAGLPAAGPTSNPDRIGVKAFRFSGNKVFTSRELSNLLGKYTGRSLSAVQLEEVRLLITQHYVNNGYVNSGCLLDPQKVEDGIVDLRIIEGKLTELHVSGTKWLRAGYIKPRIWRGAGEPLNLNQLQETMLLLREKPYIQDIKAELQPGKKKGEGVLDVRVEDKLDVDLTFIGNNHRPPSVGAEGLDAQLAVHNPSGWGDQLSITAGLLQHEDEQFRIPGTANIGARYEVPITSQDTTLHLRFDRRNYGVVEEPFDALDIETIAEYYAVDLRHPLRKSLTEELALSLTAEFRENRTFLASVPFNLAPGAVDGETRVAVLRPGLEYLKRGRKQVFAARLTASFGLDVLDATDDGTDRDNEFVSIAGQAQYLRILNDDGYKLVLGSGFQWTPGPLLSLEQFSIGGVASVRGYRENSIVRDIGIRGSAELRIPLTAHLFTDRFAEDTFQLVPFFDIGAAWNSDGPTPDPAALPSAGLGFIWNPLERLNTRFFWGYAFESPADTSGDLQDHGLHFSLTYSPF